MDSLSAQPGRSGSPEGGSEYQKRVVPTADFGQKYGTIHGARVDEQATANKSLTGLTTAEAQRRLAEYGANEIAERRPHAVLTLLRKFWSPIPWMLEATILIQVLLGKTGEAAIVGALLAFNAAVSFIEEGRANRALTLLRKRLTTRARVLRDDRWQSVGAASIVPGDCVHIRMGDLSPADIRIVNGDVLLDQSALTGESVPVEAKPGTLAYAAAIVRRGEATGEVLATGQHTFSARQQNSCGRHSPRATWRGSSSPLSRRSSPLTRCWCALCFYTRRQWASRLPTSSHLR